LSAQADTLDLPFESVDRTRVDPIAFQLLPPEYIKKHAVLPIRFDGDTLIIGMADPANIFLLDEVKRRLA